MLRKVIKLDLLKEIIDEDKEIKKVEYFPEKNEVRYYWDDYWKHGSFISMPELMLKCKKWALKHEYEIMSRTEVDIGTMTKGSAMIYDADMWLDEGHWFGAKTEPEAVIRCTEWLYEKIQKER